MKALRKKDYLGGWDEKKEEKTIRVGGQNDQIMAEASIRRH